MIPGSYANGFAPHDLEPEYQQLWRGCVGAWCPSLGPTGAILRDWSGQSHGTLTNMTLDTAWNIDKRYCLRLVAASSQYVDLGVPASLNGLAKITICGWINRNAVGVNNGYLISKRVSGSDDAFQLSVGAANQLSLDLWISDVRLTVSSSASITAANTWYHLAAAYDGVQMLTYVDGRLDCPSPVSASGSIDSTVDPIMIGRSYSPDFSMDGLIDDIRIYNRALTAAEVSLLYTGGTGRGIAYTMREWTRLSDVLVAPREGWPTFGSSSALFRGRVA